MLFHGLPHGFGSAAHQRELDSNDSEVYRDGERRHPDDRPQHPRWDEVINVLDIVLDRDIVPDDVRQQVLRMWRRINAAEGIE